MPSSKLILYLIIFFQVSILSTLSAGDHYRDSEWNMCKNKVGSVKADYRADQSCSSLPLPWSDGFESLTTVGSSVFPACWYKENGDWASANSNSSSTHDPRTGSNYAYITGNAINEYLWTPGFQLEAGVNYNFNFWYRGASGSGFTAEVGCNTSQNSSGVTFFSTPFLTASAYPAYTYTEKTSVFEPTVSGIYYFCVVVNASTSANYLCFDDFSVEYTKCSKPINLKSRFVKSTHLSFEWQSSLNQYVGSEFEWEVRASGLPGTGTSGLMETGNTSSLSDTTTLGNLFPNSNYSVYVRNKFNSNIYSNWILLNVLTACAGTTSLPWSEGLEGFTGILNFPPCWRVIDGRWRTTAFSPFYLPRTGTRLADITLPLSNARIVTPTFHFDSSKKYRFKFWFRYDGKTGWNGDVAVINMQTNSSSTVISSPYLISNLSGDSYYQSVSRDFAPVQSGDFAFVVRVDANSNPISIAFDDFSVEELPACSGSFNLAQTLSSEGISVCENRATVLSVSNTVNKDVGYQWQYSTDNQIWNDIQDAVSEEYVAIINSMKWYRLRATCLTASVSNTSAPIQITVRPAKLCYCLPRQSGGLFINSVKFASINYPHASASTPFYSKDVKRTYLEKGSSNAIEVITSTITSMTLNAWLDIDQNGIFDPAEIINFQVPTALGQPFKANIIIPPVCVSGQTVLRIKTANPGNGQSTNPCPTADAGVCEDYLVTIVEACPNLYAKVLLGNFDPVIELMSDPLRKLTNFPLSDPYSSLPLANHFSSVANPLGVVSTSQAVIDVEGPNAIVDWVFIELRTGLSGTSTVQYTRAALLQRDGDIVDMDGISPVGFVGAIPGNYFVAVRYRNHIGIRTINNYHIAGINPVLNFSDGSVMVYGNSGMISVGSRISMRGGDSNSDGSVDSLDPILWELQNGLFDDYLLNADYNIDSSVDSLDSINWETSNGVYEELD